MRWSVTSSSPNDASVAKKPVPRGKDTRAFSIGEIVYRRGRPDDLARVVAIKGDMVVVTVGDRYRAAP